MKKTIRELIKKPNTNRKALEIIKEKRVDIMLLDCDDVGMYNRHFSTSQQLTQEEFNLLKEVLE